MNTAAGLYLSFTLYFLLLLGIGWMAWKRTTSLADYLLGGRHLGRWVAALSAGASDMSGWLLLGLPGYAYLAGLESLWIAAGLLLGSWLNWLLVAPRLRERTESLDNALTLPAYFDHRFPGTTHGLRLLTGFFVLLFFLFYTSSGLVAGGKLFESVFGLPYNWAVICGALVILAYTSIGGFFAVCWTDLFQGLLMVIALVITALTALSRCGWLTGTGAELAARNPQLLDPMSNMSGLPLGLIGWLSLVGWGLGYFGQPHILVRFMAIEATAMIGDARRIAISWSLLSMVAAITIGLCGLVLLPEQLTGGESEKVFMELVQWLFHPLVAGICLAAILAAIMSTADSQLLVASSVISEDLLGVFVSGPVDERLRLRICRIAVAVIAVVATLLALTPESKVLELVSYAWAGFGACFGPAILLSLYWQGMTRAGALAGIASGGCTVIIWGSLEGGLFDLYELVPGFFISLICIFLASRITGPGSRNQV